MPYYIFKHPKKEIYKEIFFHMNDEKKFEENGVIFERVFTVPQAAISTKLDPFNKNQFIEKTGNSKGSFGDLIDRSKELSEIRSKKCGVDPLKQKSIEKWKKERKRKDGSLPKHPTEIVKSFDITG